jgi:hypothetical protein
MNQALIKELATAEDKAIDSLARYKFAMFGYWAGIWVHLNRISGENRPNPFKELVTVARKLQGHKRDSMYPDTTYSSHESQVHSPILFFHTL